MNNIYKQLPVKGKIVIDIGANIADSSIYFALCGANKVIGLEPFPKNYEFALRNVQLNNLSNKITIHLGGCAATNGEVTVDPVYESDGGSILKDFEGGIKVPLMTLENVLNRNNITSHEPTVLKMDCEGCEYETILSTDDDILQRFSHMMIEYHYGYKNLKEKIEKCGFKVSATRPRIYRSDLLNLREGYIFAKRY